MIVFPMAGLSSRFYKAGFQEPKWMLPLAGKPLFDWSLLGFSAEFNRREILIIHLDRPGIREFVQARCTALGIEDPRLVALSAPTLGQADTVRLGLAAIHADPDSPLTIFNVDTIRPKVDLAEFAIPVAGWLETFVGSGDHWSFVRAQQNNPSLAAEVVEKRRISPNCCSGLYHFSTIAFFQEALACEESNPSSPELYVAPLYQHLIRLGCDIGFTQIQPHEIFFSGTPDEYRSALTQERQLLAAFEG